MSWARKAADGLPVALAAAWTGCGLTGTSARLGAAAESFDGKEILPALNGRLLVPDSDESGRHGDLVASTVPVRRTWSADPDRTKTGMTIFE
jgi:hypothetical protein